MARRTLFEIDALVDVVMENIHKAREAKIQSEPFKTKIEELMIKYKIEEFYKEIEQIDEDVKSLNERKAKLLKDLAKRLKDKSIEYYYREEEHVKRAVIQQVTKFPPIDRGRVRNEIILASDVGADIIIMEITKKFA